MPESSAPEKHEVEEAVQKVPAFSGLELSKIKHQRLGGLTNRVYSVETPAGPHVLRIPGAGTSSYIDRKVESHNARVASDCGVSPELVYFDATDGLMVTRFQVGTVTMSANLFKRRRGAPRRAAEALRRMHRAPEPFQYRFELFAKIEEYRAYLDQRNTRYPDGYSSVIMEASSVKAALATAPASLAPCHCDPLAENFLDDGERMWIVDWEYSGMNDPIWDLGDLSVEASFDGDQDEELLHAYGDGVVDPGMRGRFVIYKAMCDLLWTLWGLIQHVNENPAEDFWQYSVTRFERCQRQMDDSQFGRHLANIR